MRKPILETRPGRRRRRDVVSIVETPVAAREHLLRIERVGDDRVDWDIGQVAALVRPGERGAVRRACHAQHMAGRAGGVLVEAAKLAPKNSHELALVYEKAKQKGNTNRATIAVARKMVMYLLAIDRGQRPFVPVESFSTAVSPN